MMAVYQRARAAGARANCRPVNIPLLGAGAVYLNDTQGFSYELLWLKPGKGDRDWGFVPKPLAQRPAPDTHRIEQRVRIAAPLDKVWAQVSDHEGMAKWSGFGLVQRIRNGDRDLNGLGSERLMRGPTGQVVEQVIDWNPPHSLRYRVIEGTPVTCHLEHPLPAEVAGHGRPAAPRARPRARQDPAAGSETAYRRPLRPATASAAGAIFPWRFTWPFPI
jgi:hypothetical protein